MAETFTALVLEEAEKKVTASIKQLDQAALPDGEVTVRVGYSDLNYKDGMIVSGIGRLVRDYPHVPGIDFAGIVEQSDSADYKPGDHVILTGWRVGEVHWGGYAEMARIKADWLVPMPVGLDDKCAMALGTAGFTAMLAVMALEEAGVAPDSGPVLVTGANGGVGGVAIALLSSLGYTVEASTGRPELTDHLKSLGAAEIVPRAELETAPDRPMLKERWAGAVDAVGGDTLATLLASMKYCGAVAACGLAGGAQLNTTVIPFLLRGVRLLGVDSVMCATDRRRTAWTRLAKEMPLDLLDSMTEVIGLDAVAEQGAKILKGETRGRVVIDLSK